MKIVEQLTPYTCGLANLESLTADFPPPISQAAMLIKYQAMLIADARVLGDFGCTSMQAMKHIWDDAGFTGDWQKDHRQDVVRDGILKQLTAKQSVFLISNYQKNGWHCIRFAGLKDDDTVFAMVPEFGGQTKIREVSFQNLIAWDFSFAVVTR